MSSGRFALLGSMSLLSIFTASCSPGLEASNSFSSFCSPSFSASFRPEGAWIQPGQRQAFELLPGVELFTGATLTSTQPGVCLPELADPYATQLVDSFIISGTAQYFLKFRDVLDIASGGPFEVAWNDYYYSDGALMEGDRYYANSWDTKPSLWSAESGQTSPRLWSPSRDAKAPLMVWYGGHMRPGQGNYSRDVFAFTESGSGKWFSQNESVFSVRGDWPRAMDNYLGHRYGHQIVTLPGGATAIFYEEVTQIRASGLPAQTEIFMDEMATPFQVRGHPSLLISPTNPLTGQPYPSAVREDGAVLVEGPLYFRFRFQDADWEAIGFSAGSYYGHYPAVFASRKVADGLVGKPYVIDLEDDGKDFHDAGASLAKTFQMHGGPGRPAVMVDSDGQAILDQDGSLQLLFHGYSKLFDSSSRVVVAAKLQVQPGTRGGLRFEISQRPAQL